MNQKKNALKNSTDNVDSKAAPGEALWPVNIENKNTTTETKLNNSTLKTQETSSSTVVEEIKPKSPEPEKKTTDTSALDKQITEVLKTISVTEKNENPNNSLTTETKQEILDLSLENIFVNLILISKIEVGNKLIQTDKYINIDSSYFQFFTRWYKGVNRNDNLEFIRMVLNKAFIFYETLLDKKDKESSQVLFRLTTDLKNSINGLYNLKQTYINDKLIQSELDFLIKSILIKVDTDLKS